MKKAQTSNSPDLQHKSGKDNKKYSILKISLFIFSVVLSKCKLYWYQSDENQLTLF